jgi:acetyltransferase-like isoleucine patch superfamily enzyme
MFLKVSLNKSKLTQIAALFKEILTKYKGSNSKTSQRIKLKQFLKECNFMLIKYWVKIVLRLAGLIPVSRIRVWLLRQIGVKIGDGCRLFKADWGTEPYLIELGNHVVVSNNVRFLTHDGAIWVFRTEYPNLDIFGSIRVGNNVCLGFNVILLPNTEIGHDCIVAAGSVVKGKIPPRSVVFGNPAKVVMSIDLQRRLMLMSRFRFESKRLSYRQKKRMLSESFSKIWKE